MPWRSSRRAEIRWASAPTPGVVDDGRYHALSTGGGLALSVSGSCGSPIASIADVEPLRGGDAAQQWTFSTNPDGTVRITDGCDTATHRHTVLSAGASAGNSAYLLDLAPGTPVTTDPPAGQSWTLSS